MELPSYSAENKRESRLPPWLKKRFGEHEAVHRMKRDLRGLKLHTVCEEARCPNIGECWSRGTATIMVLGDTCTRHCGFCSVTAGKPAELNPQEPANVADMVSRMGLKHVVITMVARDDLPDGGAGHLANIVRETRGANPRTAIEVLTSDFQGDPAAILRVVESRPEVFNHNIETVERLTPRVRHRAGYSRSLELLKFVKDQSTDMITKSGLMLGLGEKDEEVLKTLQDLRAAGCQLLTIGQYLRPSSRNLAVVEYLRPEVFEEWGRIAGELGFKNVASGPFVRSSYHAEELVTWNSRG